MKFSMSKFLAAGLVTVALALSGCGGKEPVEIVSVKVLTDADRGSGNFNRVLEVCLDKPIKIKSPYFHTMTLVTNEGFELSGGSWMRHMASDPKNPCQWRNLYLYLGRDDPPGSRPMIDEYVVPGNIRELQIKLYAQEPVTGQERPMAERTFRNI